MTLVAVSDDRVSAGRDALWWRWFVTVTVGEFLGFAVPATIAALTVHADAPVNAVALLVAGTVEGIVLGSFQAYVLRMVFTGLRPAAWVAATAAGALVAWSMGVVPILTDGFAGWPVLLMAPVVTVGGIVLLSSIGVAQWVVLRAHADGATRWIWATAVAWLAGLAVFTAFTTPLWQPGQDTAAVVAIGIVGGVLMAASMAAVTGWFLVRLVSARTR